ncbi:hypothetical protein VNO77_30888 [Canavalia gladiata]|uniref:Uncharacterized protein n=1 Tax=Canavalia gladiata TaxID=3824 RepID=A0AAN9Q4F6_CANGL
MSMVSLQGPALDKFIGPGNEFVDEEHPQKYHGITFKESLLASGDTTDNKRSSPDFDDGDHENDPFGQKKSKVEEATSGVTTGMILSLCERMNFRLQNLRFRSGTLHFKMKPFIPGRATPTPKLVINYLQALKSSEESLKEKASLHLWTLELQPEWFFHDFPIQLTQLGPVKTEREHLALEDYLKRLCSEDLDLSVRSEALDWIWKVGS